MNVKSKKAKRNTYSVPLCLCGAILFLTVPIPAQWIKQTVNTTASFRGLSVVNEKVIWASGTGGTVIKTTDGGRTWKVMTVPGAEKLDFRDIEAFDANSAYVLSIGNGEGSRIYKTTDGGTTWKEQFRNKNEKAFFDAIACWDRKNCLAMSDPVEGKFLLVETKNGEAWSVMDNSNMPPAKDGEAAFAASGTCLIAQGKNRAFLVTGGSVARVFRTNDRGKTWNVADTPVTKGTPGSGIFSIAMLDEKNGVIVGGNYERPEEAKDNAAFTSDGGITWKLSTGLTGYRSSVGQVTRSYVIAAGTNGTDISFSRGNKWAPLEKSFGTVYKTTLGFNAIASLPKAKPRVEGPIWAVGPNGLVVRSHTTFYNK